MANWSAQQLVEFSTSVSLFGDERSAIRGAIERAAEAFEAEVGAYIRDGQILDAVGFAPGDPARAQLLATVAGEREIEIPGVGRASTIVAPMEDDSPAALVLARSGEQFTTEESSLLRGMGRMLTLTLRGLRALETERALRGDSERHSREREHLLASLRERQHLLERLSTIQRSISHRDDLQKVLDQIVRGAHELLGDEIVGLRLIDAHDPGHVAMVSSFGVAPDVLAETFRSAVGQGIGGRAIQEGRLIISQEYSSASGGLAPFEEDNVRAAMAAPVHENGKVVGSLTVASRRAGRHYSSTEQDVLLAFAEHASLALTDARTVEAQLYQAFHDALTGLPNRARFFERLETAMQDPETKGVGVLFLDLDRFKVVNDSLGHTAGDSLLIAVADRLRSCLRADDVAARLGGDEFAILTLGCARAKEIVPIAERVINAMREPFTIAGREVFITASVGLAVRGALATEAGDLLRNADVAMYRAKTAGQGRYAVFEPGMHVAMIERLDLEGDLRGALERGEFVVHYQPIMSLYSGALAGFEALVRWQHPERGLIQPAEFIPLAEETGAIVALGRWVLERATRDVNDWHTRYRLPAPLSLSVNLSPRQFQQASLVRQISETIAASGLDPSCVVLEITESVLMHDTEPTIAKLWQIKRLGVRLAIDDFGTGYSSLSYLRRFPVDILKVDKSFIDGLRRGPEESALARAIVRLGHSLDLQTVAEGIEDREQLETLLALRCDFGQGFFYARPLDHEAAERFIVERGGGSRRGLRSVS